MPLLNTARCDCGCEKELFLGGPEDKDVTGAEELLQVTDANSKRFFFLTADCLRRWAAKYTSPYARPKSEFVPLDDILPGVKAN